MSSGYVAVHVRPEAREALRAATARLGGLVGRRVEFSPALMAALAVVERHMDELADELAAELDSQR